MATNQLVEDAKIVSCIDMIRNSDLDYVQKIQGIERIKKSKLIGSNSSVKTILSTTNTMLGSTTLIVPVIFAKIGIITSILSMMIICIVNFLTANILIRHGR